MREGLLMSILFSGESKGFYRICYWYSMICRIANLYLANMFAFTNLALVYVLVSVITIRTWSRTSLSDSEPAAEQPRLILRNQAWRWTSLSFPFTVHEQRRSGYDGGFFPSSCSNDYQCGYKEQCDIEYFLCVPVSASFFLSRVWIILFYEDLNGVGLGVGRGDKWQLRSSLKFSCQLRNAKNWNFNPEILKMFLEFLIVNSFTFNWVKISNFQQAIKITDKITFSLITDKEPRF